MKRGLIFNLASNVVFFFSGYVLHFFLGNTMPPASYGIVGTIITVLDFEYMFLSNGARQSLAKEISFKQHDIVDIITKTIAFQMIIIAFFFMVNFAGAPLFGIVLNDSSLELYFRVLAFLIPANGVFAILLGINDGLQRFGSSALLSIIYPILKLGVIPLIIFVFRDDPVIGVEVGFLTALLVTVLIGLVMLLAGRYEFAGRRMPSKIRFTDVASHTLSFSFFFIVVSLVLSVDTLVVKSVVEPASMAGYYTGAVNFGKISYYLMSAFVTVILPVISKLVGEGKLDQAMAKAREIVIIAFAVILPISVIIAASSKSLLSAFYGQNYQIAAHTLSMLALSNFCMGMTVMLNMILSSHVATHFSDVLSIGSLIVIVPLFIVAAHMFGINGISTASLISTFILMIISWAKLRETIGDVMSRQAWFLLFGAVTLGIFSKLIFDRISVNNLLILAILYAILYIAYIGLLVVTKVIQLRDFTGEKV